MYELAPGPKKVVEKKGRLVFYRQHENVSHNPQLLMSTMSHLMLIRVDTSRPLNDL